MKLHTSVEGFSLIELLLTLLVGGVLVIGAAASYTAYIERAEASQAAADLSLLEQHIAAFQSLYKRLPASLAELNMAGISDPWGNNYVYQRISNTGVPAADQTPAGNERTDGAGNTINSDYDLYSRGKDGVTTASVTGGAGSDDVIRGQNGRYLGPAKDYA